MKFLSRVAACASIILTASVLASGVATAGSNEGATSTDATVAGGDYIEDCYYSGGYRGCSYFYGYTEPFEKLIVCDTMSDTRYTKGRIKFLGYVYEVGPVNNGCITTYWDLPEGTHLGIHTGVEGLGWTPYEYGYA